VLWLDKNAGRAGELVRAAIGFALNCLAACAYAAEHRRRSKDGEAGKIRERRRFDDFG
jgi:hypothetical protein